ncbi:unnamed protein product [Dimorphilus gyrociliatus]|uniref:NACHT domain-containing protein n=1 Tax=Dimorphilus gyrociliatus TaxID=2664684 RepID=A0A7I8WF21_9ANNE|nr:unnamed protein product [Dimorphilus gyrociliatus]
MNYLQKLSISMNRDKLFSIFKTFFLFKKICKFLKDRRIISSESEQEFCEIFKRNDSREMVINNLMDIFLKLNFDSEICKILKQLEKEEELNIFDEISNLYKNWKMFVDNVKELRRKDSACLSLFTFTNNRFIQLDEIVVSIEMKKDNLKKHPDLEQKIIYSNFFLIFEKGYSKVLVKGQPGIGKSVHVKNLIHTWANNKWKDIEKEFLLLKVVLKNVERNNDIFDEIIRQNFEGIDYINKDIVESMIREKSNEIILLLDGIDELFFSDYITFNQFIYEGNCPVQTVLWSRNWKANDFQNSCDIIFELIGFNGFDLTDFFNKCFKDFTGTELFQFKDLQKNPMLMEFCRVPLLAMIIFFLWKEKGEIIDMKLFHLYENIIKVVQSFRNKDHNILDEKLKLKFYFNCLTTLSDTTQNIQLNSEELEILDNVYGNILHFIPNRNSTNEEVQVQFYHRSFQEYFAAIYIIHSYEKLEINQLDSVLGDILEKYPEMKLFNVLNFISSKSVDLGVDILKVYKNFEKMNHTSWMSQLDDVENRYIKISDGEINPAFFHFLVENKKLKADGIELEDCSLIDSEYFSKTLQISDSIEDIEIYNERYISPSVLVHMIELYSKKESFDYISIKSSKFWEADITKQEGDSDDSSCDNNEDFYFTLTIHSLARDMIKGFEKVLESCQLITTLHFEFSEDFTEDGLSFMTSLTAISKLKSLKNLYISKPKFKKKFFFELLKSIPKSIKKLVLNSCIFKSTTYFLLCDFVQEMSFTDELSIIELNVVGWIFEKKENFYSISFKKQRVKLKVDNCPPKLKKKKIHYKFYENIQLFFLSSKPAITTEFIPFNHEEYGGNHFYLKIIMDKFPDHLKSDSLVSVDITGLLNNTDCSVLSKLLKNIGMVKEVFLRELEKIDSGLQIITDAMVLSCNNLSSVSFENCGNSYNDYYMEIGKFLGNCKFLQYFKLTIPAEYNKTYYHLKVITDGLRQSAEHIREIHLYYLSLTDEDSFHFGEFIKVCSSLEKIDLDEVTFLDLSFENVLMALQDCSQTLFSFNYTPNLIDTQQKALDDLQNSSERMKTITTLLTNDDDNEMV